MAIHHFVVYSLITFSLSTIVFSYSQDEEYCMTETFHARCKEAEEVIVITEATYGVIKLDRCINFDHGHLGCQMDALPYLDRSCSGKSECDYLVPGADLHRNTPCDTSFAHSLYVQYQCVPVMPQGECGSTPLPPADGYLSSYVAKQSSPCPWQLDVLPGQTVNISLIDFERGSEECEQLGVITEHDTQRTIPICRSAVRESHLFTSEGHGLVLELRGDITGDYLIHYTVRGCADLVAPDNAWYKRSGQTASIGCSHANVSWHLTCGSDYRWHGVVGVCNYNKSAGTVPPKREQKQTGIPVVLFTLVTAIVLLLIILVCTAAYVLIKRCSCSSPSSNNGGFETYPEWQPVPVRHYPQHTAEHTTLQSQLAAPREAMNHHRQITPENTLCRFPQPCVDENLNNQRPQRFLAPGDRLRSFPRQAPEHIGLTQLSTASSSRSGPPPYLTNPPTIAYPLPTLSDKGSNKSVERCIESSGSNGSLGRLIEGSHGTGTAKSSPGSIGKTMDRSDGTGTGKSSPGSMIDRNGGINTGKSMMAKSIEPDVDDVRNIDDDDDRYDDHIYDEVAELRRQIQEGPYEIKDLADIEVYRQQPDNDYKSLGIVHTN